VSLFCNADCQVELPSDDSIGQTAKVQTEIFCLFEATENGLFASGSGRLENAKQWVKGDLLGAKLFSKVL
jgi:hypothetical protein